MTNVVNMKALHYETFCRNDNIAIYGLMILETRNCIFNRIKSQ